MQATKSSFSMQLFGIFTRKLSMGRTSCLSLSASSNFINATFVQKFQHPFSDSQVFLMLVEEKNPILTVGKILILCVGNSSIQVLLIVILCATWLI